MKTARRFYHWNMVIIPLLGIAYLLASIINLLIRKGDIFYIVCLSIITAAISTMLLIPAIKDLHKYQKEEKR